MYQKFVILHTVAKPTNAYKRIRVSYIIITVGLLYLVRTVLKENAEALVVATKEILD